MKMTKPNYNAMVQDFKTILEKIKPEGVSVPEFLSSFANSSTGRKCKTVMWELLRIARENRAYPDSWFTACNRTRWLPHTGEHYCAVYCAEGDAMLDGHFETALAAAQAEILAEKQ